MEILTVRLEEEGVRLTLGLTDKNPESSSGTDGVSGRSDPDMVGVTRNEVNPRFNHGQ